MGGRLMPKSLAGSSRNTQQALANAQPYPGIVQAVWYTSRDVGLVLQAINLNGSYERITDITAIGGGGNAHLT